ncbi:MAG: alpha/beta fold hydrolase, partial [Candidatus Limnocylindria bacterium]
MFGPIIGQLAANHQVIVPDLQGHGRTTDIDRPIDIRLMADDIARLIDHLGFDKPDLVGYSLGGGVLLHGVEVPGEDRQARHGLDQHPAGRHLCRDARAAGPGQRGGSGVRSGAGLYGERSLLHPEAEWRVLRHVVNEHDGLVGTRLWHGKGTTDCDQGPDVLPGLCRWRTADREFGADGEGLCLILI